MDYPLTPKEHISTYSTAQGACVFTVDVEDWFHILDIPSSPPLARWASLPSRVEGNFFRLLDLFSEKQVHVTCFFLGWIADHFPHLVKEAVRRGHEVASHGYAHRLVNAMSREEFRDDVVRAKKLLEDVGGKPVLGYRAPGFSLTSETSWLFDEIIAAGYRYDSSIFPAVRGHGGNASFSRKPTVWGDSDRPLIEFPITVTDFGGQPVCLFGGGYLRFFPYSLIRREANKVLSRGRPVVFYIHPREIDPEHPRLPMNAYRQFKSYFNLKSTLPKVSQILDDFRFCTFQDLIAAEGHRPAASRLTTQTARGPVEVEQ
jgi:polysaccharide deacetylase family protein (PEP-CTERM system associated)